jgi:environmental stress-induced protein Ves
MSFVVLPAARRQALPWRNGGGITREIAAAPPGAGFDAFHWRISTAEIHDPGPFSRFDGVDRVLTVLTGRLQLKLEGQNTIVLDDATEPHSFPGEAPVHGAPLGGPVTDLNVMVRRDGFTGTVRRIAPGSMTPNAGLWLFVALDAGCFTVGAAHFILRQHDAVRATLPTPVPIETNAPGLLIELTRLA